MPTARRHARRVPGCPRRSRSTTRRFATAPSKRGSRSRSTTSCASPSSSTTSASPTSRAAGPAPTRRTPSSSSGPRSELQLETRHARRLRLDAAGRRRGGGRPVARQPLAPDTEAVCIVAKASDLHVTETLRTSLDEAVAMVADSVALPACAEPAGLLRRRALLRRLPRATRSSPSGPRRRRGGRRRGPRAVRHQRRHAARRRRRDRSRRPRADVGAQLGVHFHNDSGCAVANTLAAVHEGATQVQGCVNGYGERAGNADLSAAIPNLSLEDGRRDDPARADRAASRRSRATSPRSSTSPSTPTALRRATSAFAHKAGLHTSAIARSADAYEHVAPDAVGNGTRVVVSELAGRSTLAMKAAELGIDLDGEVHRPGPGRR